MHSPACIHTYTIHLPESCPLVNVCQLSWVNRKIKMMLPPESGYSNTIVCPYNKAHHILKERFQIHLVMLWTKYFSLEIGAKFIFYCQLHLYASRNMSTFCLFHPLFRWNVPNDIHTSNWKYVRSIRLIASWKKNFRYIGVSQAYCFNSG